MSNLEPAVTLPWLVRLRWSFVAGQLVVLPGLHEWFGLPMNLSVLGVELGIMLASNIVLAAVQRDRRWSRSAVIGAVILLDTGLWTLMLAGSGGTANPFTVLYLVHITLSTIVLGRWWTWIIAVLSLAGFALLFVTTPMHAMHEAMGFAGHLQAMWGAFALAAVLIAFFVGRVTRAIAGQRQQIANLREANERTERHASVMRLAAGAAHELGSPLATIAVAAHEAKLRLAGSGNVAAVIADLELVGHEIERCQTILQRISTRSNEADGTGAIQLAQLADAIRDRLGEQHSHRVDLMARDPELVLQQPRDPLTDSLVALIKNALDATRGEDRVEVELARDAVSSITITIADRGDGIREDVLARVGTPFFTTKQPGRGLGLGVFLARAFFESRGGGFALESVVGRGTRAVVHLPLGGAT